MFTGIVTELGVVQSIEVTPAGRRIILDAAGTAADMKVGDSVAVNGVCLTALQLDAGKISLDVVHETLQRSNLGDLQPGDGVDLERPLTAVGRFDGHVVQGHVDGIGTVTSIRPEGTASRIRFDLPERLGRYVVEKGSVTVDGVSLTVTAVSPAGDEQWFDVVLIPHTLEVTVLGERQVGDRVNLEMDVIAKYVERMMEAHA